MTGKVVTVSSLDSVRIETRGAVTIPAGSVLDIDTVLRHCLEEEEGLDVDMVSEDARGFSGWEARAGNSVGYGDTPWAAIAALARQPGVVRR